MYKLNRGHLVVGDHLQKTNVETNFEDFENFYFLDLRIFLSFIFFIYTQI